MRIQTITNPFRCAVLAAMLGLIFCPTASGTREVSLRGTIRGNLHWLHVAWLINRAEYPDFPSKDPEGFARTVGLKLSSADQFEAYTRRSGLRRLILHLLGREVMDKGYEYIQDYQFISNSESYAYASRSVVMIHEHLDLRPESEWVYLLYANGEIGEVRREDFGDLMNSSELFMKTHPPRMN